MRNDNVNKRALAVTTVAALMLIATMTSMATTENVVAYTRNQATSSANACGNGEVPTNVGCQNTASQIQGDENSVALTSQQTFPSTTTSTEPPTTITRQGTLFVIKEVVCPAGIACPDPEDFGLTVTGTLGATPASFQGASAPGTEVKLPIPESGFSTYQVDETSAPTLPAGQTLTVTESPDCTGTISAGDTKTCTVTNTIDLEDLIG